MFSNIPDFHQLEPLITRCYIRGDSKSERFGRDFSTDFLLLVDDWLIKSDILFSEPLGLFSVIGNLGQTQEPWSSPRYEGYLAYVRSLLSHDSRGCVPGEIRERKDEEIEMAAAIVQLVRRPDDLIGKEYVENFLRRAELDDLHHQIAERFEFEGRLLETVKPYFVRQQRMLSATRNKPLKALVRRLISESGSADYQFLWQLLIRKFEDRDVHVCALFADLVEDETGLRNGDTLKSDPRKFIYMDSIQSGCRKGEERYLTYARFRRHVRKIKDRKEVKSVPS